MDILWGTLFCAACFVLFSGITITIFFFVRAYRLQYKNSGFGYGDFSAFSTGSTSETPCADYSKRAIVACSGQKNDDGKLFVYRGYNDCKSLSMLYSGDNVCQWSCLGKGDCQSVCTTNAIDISCGTAIIGQTCIGCGACIPMCPRHIISLVPATADYAVFCASKAASDTSLLCSSGCTACGNCVVSGGYSGFRMDENSVHAYIDYRSSANRDIAKQVCPSGCIRKLPETEKNDIKKYRLWIILNAIHNVLTKYSGINKAG